MKKEEYYSKKESLKLEQKKLDKKFYALDKEYLKSLNDKYAHLLKKKVVVTYVGFGYNRYGERPQKTITCYWNGYRRDTDGYFIPMLRRIKRDGTMSSKSLSTYIIFDIVEIISMVKAE